MQPEADVPQYRLLLLRPGLGPARSQPSSHLSRVPLACHAVAVLFVMIAWLALRLLRLTAILAKIRERRRAMLSAHHLDVAFPDDGSSCAVRAARPFDL